MHYVRFAEAFGFDPAQVDNLPLHLADNMLPVHQLFEEVRSEKSRG